MNQQREVIYDLRLFALEGGEDLKAEVWEMVEAAVKLTVPDYATEDVHPEEWDLAGLRERIAMDYFLVLEELPRENTPEHDFNSVEDIEELVLRSVRDGFRRKLEGFGELQERILSWVLLTVIDDKWRDHLYDLDHLKASIGFRGWGQKDPLIEYKQEAYTMFVDLMTDLRKSVASLTFRAQVQVPQARPQPQRIVLSGPTDAPDTRPMRAVPAPEEFEQDELEDGVAHAMGSARPLPTPSVTGMKSPKQVDVRKLATNRGDDGGEAPANKPVVKEEPKVGRNDPCPCGSGKKYKKCHGAGLA